MSKAIRTKCDCGTTHDSKKEAEYCGELAIRMKARDICAFISHPEPITLVPKLRGCKAKAITWKLDFHVVGAPPPDRTPDEEPESTGYYVDVKGCLYAKRTKMRGYRETQMKIRLWQLMGIPWPLHIVYTDRVDIYPGGAE